MGYRNRRPPLLEQLAGHAAHVLATESQLPREDVERVGTLIAARIGKMLGGRKVRIPTGRWNRFGLTAEERRGRDLWILQSFDGTNAQRLASRLGLSPGHVRRIHRQLRLSTSAASTAGRREPTLPGTRRKASRA